MSETEYETTEPAADVEPAADLGYEDDAGFDDEGLSPFDPGFGEQLGQQIQTAVTEVLRRLVFFRLTRTL